MTRYRELAVALLVQIVGAGGALLIASRTWQHLTAARSGPFPNARVDMTGRDVDAAITALALVALAGVVAVLATRGWWRRAVGALVALAGAGMIVRALLSSGAVDNDRALAFIHAHRQTVTTLQYTKVKIAVVSAWPILTVISGVLVALAGGFVLARGGRWEGMSARYEPRPAEDVASDADDDAARARATAAMWTSLDRGDDPTEGPTDDPPGR